MKSRQINHIAALFALSLGLVLIGRQAVWAGPSPASEGVDPTPISSCGTLSGNNTIYQLTQNINTSSTGNCIVLGGSDNTLDLQGFNITFTGAAGASKGAGLFIESTANEDVVEGSNSTISGFQEGVLDEGANTVGDDINCGPNTVGLELAGSDSTEIWTNFSADSNTAQGVYLKSCGDECTISDFDASNNGADGVLITGSEGPRVSIFQATQNGGDGVHVGCSSSKCSGGNNSEVKVGDAPIGFAGGAALTGNAGDGLFLDKSESTAQDQIFLTFASGNGGIDLHDANNTCGDNHWVHNQFGTAEAGTTPNPSCIPNVPF
ncbi:MAG: hypothetical protein WAN81_19245 [Candidatus Binataceae bacterium]